MTVTSLFENIVAWILLVVAGMKSIVIIDGYTLFDFYIVVNAFLLGTLVLDRVFNKDIDEQASVFRMRRRNND